MLEPQEREAIEKGFLPVLIIWGAMLASLLIYVLICHLADEQIHKVPRPEFPIALIRNILMGVGGAALVLAYYMRRLMLRVRPEGSVPDSPLHTGQPKALAKYTVAVIISLALCESIGIYGVVLFFLGADFQILYIFIGASAIAMYFFRPKKEELVEMAMAMHGGEIQPPHMLH